MAISKRLKEIANLITPGYTVADIGTDHGYVPIYLLKNNISPKTFAMDMSKGSLEKAIESAERLGLSDVMECRLSDGFDKLAPYEADAAIISGMGGMLMNRILTDGIEVVRTLKEVVLSPHRDAPVIRDFLNNNGFEIIVDEVFEDKGKCYIIIKAVNRSLK